MNVNYYTTVVNPEFTIANIDPYNLVRIKYTEDATHIKYATDGAAGFDIAAAKDVEIPGRGTTIVPTGIFMQISPGYELQIRPRSGNSVKTPIRIANSPGTIDSDYTGEIGIIVDNNSDVILNIKKGDRIAQGVFAAIPKMVLKEVSNISEFKQTKRGSGGFGSTGTN